MLGPLCVGCAVFALRDHDPDDGAPDLWKILQPAVCRARRDRRRRIAIDDSKKLKTAETPGVHPLRYLERGVLATLGASDRWPGTDERFLRLVGAEVPTAPWYDSTLDLPLAQGADEIRIGASRLKRALDRGGVQCTLLRCEAIDVERFNDQVERTGSKASVNFCACMRLLDAVWRQWPGDHPRVIVDRQGGRTHYLDVLGLLFQGARIRILAESERLSRYRLQRDGAFLTVSFVRNAEAGHLPVALASMTAKYVRELFMLRLNRFFGAHLAELKPTAGYVQDARRYLGEIAPVIERLGLPRSNLIRTV